jgi:hypothetical protein
MSSEPTALRVAAVWGTTVVAMRTLTQGQSFSLGDDRHAALPIPDGLDLPRYPLRACHGGWVLDARGALDGLLTLRGRAESPAAIAKGGPVPVVPGDYGLVQYGQLSIFFQYTARPIRLSAFTKPEILVLLAIVCSFILHGGGVLITSALSTPLPLPLPPELDPDLASRFRVQRPVARVAPVTTPIEPATAAADAPPLPTGGSGGPPSPPTPPRPPREPRQRGDMGDALAGASDLRDALGRLPTVGAALRGLTPDNVITDGHGVGPGLRGGDGRPPGPIRAQPDIRIVSPSPDRPSPPPLRPPPRDVIANGPTIPPGGLPPETIRRVINQRLGAVRACYEVEAQKDPSLRGGFTASWTVAPSGAVTNLAIGSSNLGNQRVEGCVRRQIQSWTFPSSGGSTAVTLPLRFGVGG